MILSDVKHIHLSKSVNMFGTNLLMVEVCYNDMGFCKNSMSYKNKSRVFVKTEGTPWVEKYSSGRYTKVGTGNSIELTEYCSHYGHIVPKE